MGLGQRSVRWHKERAPATSLRFQGNSMESVLLSSLQHHWENWMQRPVDCERQDRKTQVRSLVSPCCILKPGKYLLWALRFAIRNMGILITTSGKMLITEPDTQWLVHKCSSLSWWSNAKMKRALKGKLAWALRFYKAAEHSFPHLLISFHFF